MINIAPGFSLPESEIELTYVRSSGPGGQNVNKVNSKAVLRWNAYSSTSIPYPIRDRVLSKLKLTTEGDLVIASDRFRDQGKNREDCFEKLRQTLQDAMHVPKVRRKTKPSRSSKIKKRVSKSKHSMKKQLRSKSYD